MRKKPLGIVVSISTRIENAVMPFVLDASVTMAWCFDDGATPETDAVLRLLSFQGAEVPALWHFEIANVLTTCIRKKRISPDAALIFLSRLKMLPISAENRIAPLTGEELLPLVLAHGLTAYDAAYLGLSQRKNLPLATLDQDLIRVARKLGIQLLAQPQ